MPVYSQQLISTQIEQLEKAFIQLLTANKEQTLLQLHDQKVKAEQQIKQSEVEVTSYTTEIQSLDTQIKKLQTTFDQEGKDPNIIAKQEHASKQTALESKIDSLTRIQIKIDSSRDLDQKELEILSTENLTAKTLDDGLVSLRKELETLKSRWILVNHAALFPRARQLKIEQSLTDAGKQQEEASKKLTSATSTLTLSKESKIKNLAEIATTLQTYPVESAIRKIWSDMETLREGQSSDAAQTLMRQYGVQDLQKKLEALRAMLVGYGKFLNTKVTELERYSKKRAPGWFRWLLEKIFRLVNRAKKVELAKNTASTIKQFSDNIQIYTDGEEVAPLLQCSEFERKFSSINTALETNIAENTKITHAAGKLLRGTEGMLGAYLQSCHEETKSKQAFYRERAKECEGLLKTYHECNPEQKLQDSDLRVRCAVSDL